MVCVVPPPFYQKEQLNKQKLHIACCMTSAWQLSFLLVFPVWKRDRSACSEAVGCLGVFARHTLDAEEADPDERRERDLLHLSVLMGLYFPVIKERN